MCCHKHKVSLTTPRFITSLIRAFTSIAVPKHLQRFLFVLLQPAMETSGIENGPLSLCRSFQFMLTEIVAVRTRLETDGTLDAVTASLRAQVFRALQEQVRHLWGSLSYVSPVLIVQGADTAASAPSYQSHHQRADTRVPCIQQICSRGSSPSRWYFLVFVSKLPL